MGEAGTRGREKWKRRVKKVFVFREEIGGGGMSKVEVYYRQEILGNLCNGRVREKIEEIYPLLKILRIREISSSWQADDMVKASNKRYMELNKGQRMDHWEKDEAKGRGWCKD